jgi:hypothetical protein
MDTFTNSNYSITSSLNERTIYLKIIDTMQYLSYEGNIELKELKLPITLKDAYTLITKCLSNTDEHLVKYSKNTNILRLDFTAKVGGYMNISFDIMLKECIIGDDAKMSMKLFEMDISNRKKSDEMIQLIKEIKHEFIHKTKELESIIQRQSEMIELFGNIPINGRNLNLKIVTYTDVGNVADVKLFYNCKTININYHTISLHGYFNNTVEELVCNSINSLQGIHNMPNLKIINITTTMTSYTDHLLKHIKEYDNKITQLIIKNTNKPDTIELQRYCKEKGIELIIQ